MIDHDRLFKELLSTFFVEFLELFLPEVVEYIEPGSITFLDKEVFTDVTAGEKYETDLLARVQFRGKPSFFLIHVENQASSKSGFGKRIFRYFARLFEKHDYPVYPIVVFSYDSPKKAATSEFKIDFPDFSVLQFNYRVIQLNQLNWRDFLEQQNPVASALMAKMKIANEDRPKVKAECLRLMVTLKLDPARMQMITGFIDSYLPLTPKEESELNIEIAQIEPKEIREEAMVVATSWKKQGELSMLQRMLEKKLGTLPESIQNQVESLTDSQIDQLCDRIISSATEEDITQWLANLKSS